CCFCKDDAPSTVATVMTCRQAAFVESCSENCEYIRGGAQERTRTFTAVKPLAPEASASTNSTTWAQNGLLRTGYAIVKLADCRPNPLYSIDTMAYRESAKSLRERLKFDPQELTSWHRI